MGAVVLDERFWSKVDKTETCWLWTAGTFPAGHGEFRYEGKGQRAHRLTYRLFVGPIPEGLEIDHMCHEPRCLNPDHLQAVTHKQNIENRAAANKSSKSGVRGVWWAKGRWSVQVKHSGVKYHGGRWDTLEEAEAAAKELRSRLFTNNLLDRKAA